MQGKSSDVSSTGASNRLCFAYAANVAPSAVNWVVLWSRQSRYWVSVGCSACSNSPMWGQPVHLLGVPHGSPKLLWCQLLHLRSSKKGRRMSCDSSAFLKDPQVPLALLSLASTRSNVLPEFQGNFGKRTNVIVTLDMAQAKFHSYSKFSHLPVNKVVLIHSLYPQL